MSLPATTSVEHSTLASSTARRQGAQLGWSLAGVLTLLLSYLIGLGLYKAGLATHQFSQTVLWCALPYLLAAHWLYQGTGLPAAERSSLLLVTTAMPFLLTPLGFALLQQPYSRGAVLLVYALSTAWFVLGDWLHRRRHTQRLLYLDPSVPERLQRLLGNALLRNQSVRLEQWPNEALAPEQIPACEGVVLDRQMPPNDARRQLLSTLKLNHVRLYSVEAVAELLSGRKMLPTSQDDLWQIDGNPAHDVAKRVIDMALVLATLPLWLPLCALVGIAVKLGSPAPCCSPKAAWVSMAVTSGSGSSAACIIIKLRSPPASRSSRTTASRVGRTIRRWRLDELPQLWNVLLGHMSLIGPRPEQTQFVHEFATCIPAYPYRHLVRPGITGWAQVQQGYADSEEQTVVKLSYDLYYVAHYSMALDLLIAYKTIRIVLNGFGSR
ncbi:sugar transferase [Polaromonas sp. P1-6]|nr:sugar transferase [Polaromonas sp. P1-6]